MAADPLLPGVSDEGPHPPEPIALWNESWYFDFVDPRRDIGGWVRLGLMPNEGVAWITALLCGPRMPTIALVDYQAPLPRNPGRVRSGTIDLSLEPLEPLRNYRVAIGGRGQAYDDPAAILRGEVGSDVDLALDLTWATAGTPYQYRLTTRYEIPCTVSGSVTFGDSAVALDTVPGQRDHSWGHARDWWSLEWMWSALHLDDGCHLHAVETRIPGMPNVAMGYLQQPGAQLVELESVSAREIFADNGLPVSATISLEPGEVVAAIEVSGHAPVRLVSAAGRISHFARVWVTATTADGRSGVGWVEWNRVQPA